MKNKIFIILALVVLCSTMIVAQNKDYSNEPGYVDFGNLTEFETGERVTEIIIESHLLKMVSKLAGKEDPDLKELLEGLKLIKVNAFEATDNNFESLEKIINKVDKKLTNERWDRIVKSKSNDAVANVYIKTDGDEEISGLVVMAIEKNGDAAFVNIVGKINLDQIGRLSEKFDVPELDKIEDWKENEK